MRSSKPAHLKPADGGRLMPGISQENVGVANYKTKRNFRREDGREVRVEGYDEFKPDPYVLSSEVIASTPVTVIAEAIRENGQRAIVAGTDTDLLRFYSSVDAVVFEADVFEEFVWSNNGGWNKIWETDYGSGVKWEAVRVAGGLAFNNGLDLPFIYRPEYGEVRPIYELRENGVSSVGSIGEENGILICGDIRQIDSDRHALLMAPLTSAVDGFVQGVEFIPSDAGGLALATVNSGVDGVDGNTLTVTSGAWEYTDFSGVGYTSFAALVGRTVRMANGLRRNIVSGTATTATLDGDVELAEPAQPFTILPDGTDANDAKAISVQPDIDTLFPDGGVVAMGASTVGRMLFWPDGSSREITGFAILQGLTHFVVDSDGPIPAGTVSLENPDAYARFEEQENIERYQDRALWSMPNQPDRFAAIIPCSSTKGQKLVNLDYPVRSLMSGVDLTVAGAGADGNNLTSQIQFVHPKASMAVLLGENTGTTVEDTDCQLSDATDSIVAYETLGDDGGAIIKILGMGGYTIFYKDTPFIFAANYTGNTDQPFQFQRIEIPEGRQPAYRDTVISVSASAHMYAAKSEFYSFDLVNREPKIAIPFEGDLFFKDASADPFCVLNPVTSEVWVSYGGDEEDKVICLESKHGTSSTLDYQITSAGYVRKPAAENDTVIEDWFLMGASDGTIYRFGKVATPDIKSGAITGTCADQAVQSSSGIFQMQHVGRSIVFESGVVAAITAYVDETEVQVNSTATVTDETFTIKPAIWHRQGADYKSTLESGLDGFGNESSEKTLSGYSITLGSMSSRDSLSIDVSLRSGETPSQDDVVLTGTIDDPILRNMVPAAMVGFFIGDKIEVDGKNNPMSITSRTFHVSGAKVRGWGRVNRVQ